jgi:hypothetical protein
VALQVRNQLVGVWRDFQVGGPVANDTVQLNWVGATGTLLRLQRRRRLPTAGQ